jgi:hypothetical protein
MPGETTVPPLVLSTAINFDPEQLTIVLWWQGADGMHERPTGVHPLA